MLKINFQVNEEYIARRMISTSNMPTAFANYLWDKYRDSYQNLKIDLASDNIDYDSIKELEESEFFIKNIQIAEKNLERIKTNWDKNEESIQNFLKQVLKIDLDLETTGYIFPPMSNIGMNIGNNSFVWGHMQGLEDSNYDLVYLVHESLHSYFDTDNLSHAIIERISDVELSRFLNGSIEHYPYHSFTREVHNKIYPYWNLYLNKTKEEILKDQAYTKIKYDIDKYEQYRDTLSNLNIDQLIEFLREMSMPKTTAKSKEIETSCEHL